MHDLASIGFVIVCQSHANQPKANAHRGKIIAAMQTKQYEDSNSS